MKPSPSQPLAGILEPVFAIRTEEDLGIGDTEGVRQMIDWCHRHRLNILQILPINELGNDNSPYNALSSLALEPSTLALSPRHLPDLTPETFLRLAPPDRVAGLRRGPVNYPEVRALKHRLLEAAFAHFAAQHLDPPDERGRQFHAFAAENRAWLDDYALFRALVEENGNTPAWDRWPPEHHSPAAARDWLRSLPRERRQELARRQLFFQYVQWLAFTQWQALKACGAARRVYLMGDIPFGVGRYSADVWANRDLFDLDWSGGAPPETTFKADPFTVKWGQNWGIPNYRWEELRRRQFGWWRTRVGNLQKLFHLYRIDHVLGFFRIYSFPWTPDRNAEFLPLTEAEAAARTGGRLPGFKPFPDDTPEHKAFNQAQGEEILRVVLAGSGETTVVAEDLGVVPDYVPPTLLKLGIPGFRIPMFFREPDGAYADPKRYPRLSLVQPATHDHPPLAAAWDGLWQAINAGTEADASRRELRQIMAFAGLRDIEPPREFAGQLHEAYSRAVLQSASWLAVFQITDLFAMTARFNTPGTVAQTNWTYRLPHTVRELEEDPVRRQQAETFSRLARESGRGC
ncbi:MAG: 4-alpha-glucanotransferase [Verrucomicrobia bacterium]|nr:4-alpha-glucanotransferase [Verrucomicrobiota bacterium]OQC26349.1 MAG: 4-alpha-glucanotransferase [Verrucomicrobia bacterium ADurb.Bin063]HRY58985.1 4-alpha-glucanotransferase [Candidatus Paceibacterota bacterium]MBP8014633.1 4-alpha-glucanotransferase [Verrucomicrobiota bacterium]MDI9371456.1 4-alpha-glucanotransferase [Verrucomicrobiota bacterium]